MPRSRTLRGLAGALGLALCFVFAVGQGIGARQDHASETAVKAAYLFHFGPFVRWPATALPSGAPFTICTFGSDSVHEALAETLQNESISGRPAAAKRITAIERARDCNILFIGDDEAREWPAVLESLRGRPVLTVSDMRDFTRRGGMVGFVLAERRVRFEVNLAATVAAGLTPSSELLRVASTVRRAEGVR